MLLIGSIICEISLVCCGIIFVRREEKRDNFKARFTCSTILIAAFMVLISHLYAGSEPLVENVIANKAGIQVVSSVAMMVYIYWNWKMNLSKVFLFFAWSRIVWWMAIETWRFLMVVLKNTTDLTIPVKAMTLVILFSIVFVICNFTISRWIPVAGRKRVGPRQLVSALLICIIYEILAYMPEMQNVITVPTERALVLFLSQLLLAIILYLQNELFRKSAMKQELELVHLLLQKEEEQYRLTKENIAIINQKCHDLKHQIRAIRQVSDEDREAYLKEVENSIRIYESIVKTGNEVLDTILTEKSLYCMDRGITISCVADGKLLHFINHMDLYSLFGNALDNAIEAVEHFEEEEKRQIDVLIHRQQNFLVVNIINPMQDTLLLEDEMPVTTKKDKHLHGFGVRSMKYIVKKYGGFFNITPDNGCFSLKILFPYKG